MITNSGKNILAKYLLGHAPSYASHIAIGCGPTPLGSTEFPEDFIAEYSQKTSLDFEMFRVPISSRGYVSENNTTYVVFTAELPTPERYAITEVGVYSAGSNPAAGVADSKIIRSFSQLEPWEYHTTTESAGIPTVSSSLDNGTNIIFPDGPEGEETGFPAFRASSDNPTFFYPDRQNRHEVPRFLDSSIILRGDSASIAVTDSGSLSPDDTESSHIHLTNVSLNLDQNAPTDKIKLAFSIINRDGADPEEPDQVVSDPEEVRIVLQFVSGETGDVQFAIMDIDLINLQDGVDFSTNRYFVVEKQLQELRKSIGFIWSGVTTIKAYVSVLESGAPSPLYYVALDGIRLDNETDIHPLYGMTGYSVVKTEDALPIIKSSNSNNFVEFRFGFDFVDPVSES